MKTMAAIVAVLALAAGAQEKFKKRDLKDRQEIAGKIVCIGCTLEQQDGGADSQCTLHAKHAQGILMADGTLWTLVDNGRGHHLITSDKLKGKEVKVLGWKFPRAQYIEAWKFQLKDGDKWVPYDYCKVCGYEAGHDNKDQDLCQDCSGK
jgi:hypothetical protein